MEKIFEQQPSDCLKIVLFGPESTGKTTLATQLAAHYASEWVPEYMRTYLQKKWDREKETISKEDLLPIAKGQIRLENNLAKSTSDYLFCDTNLLELQVYCEYYYNGWCPKEIATAVHNHQYHYYFLTGIDVPWKADDLRDRPFDRSTLFRNFENALKERNIAYTLLKGSPQERLQNAIEILDKRFTK
ncbi:MAG TPA: nicotinate-nucleotide adenylyltransferase [Flavobacteriaceae bacterium]|nr:nicotinate-nucleotide adenylyltransferase [Flavobacteriaceae bacterium]HBR52864.1 nicotinate-nucleotide adenylyltransferase [Flavobacteriaceae bacterium]|tara:strand:- start:931 stop:1494 length:564 start_codon:yes stop_codon:yes gene_type:complete